MSRIPLRGSTGSLSNADHSRQRTQREDTLAQQAHRERDFDLEVDGSVFPFLSAGERRHDARSSGEPWELDRQRGWCPFNGHRQWTPSRKKERKKVAPPAREAPTGQQVANAA
jgi:hypothetical protein